MDTNETRTQPADTSQAGAQFSTRPDGSASTFSEPGSDKPKNANPPLASERALDPNGRLTDRPDVAYQTRLENERLDAERRQHLDRAIAQAPLYPGLLFNFNAVAGQGAALRAEGMGDGTLAITMSPDGALPVSVRLSGLDLARFRRAIWDGKPDLR